MTFARHSQLARPYSRGDYKFVAGDASDELLWLLGPEGLQNTIRSSPTNRPNFHARSATAAISLCVTVGRTNQTTCSSTVDHTARSTADTLMRTRCRLSSRRTAGPCWSIPGLTPTPDRKSCAIGFAVLTHNTVTVDNTSSSVPDGAFTWKHVAECRLTEWITTDRYDYVAGEQAGLARSIFFLKGKYWIVRDTNKSSTAHTADINFHFDSGTNPCLKDGAIHEPGSGLTIRVTGNGRWIEENQWVSHCYGQKEPAKVFRFSSVLQPGESVYTFLLL